MDFFCFFSTIAKKCRLRHNDTGKKQTDDLPFGTVLYNILIFSWAVSVWWRILHAQTRRCLLGAAALMLFWLDIRLIRYDFAQTPEMLRRLWYAYYIPMLLIPTLALYTLFFLDRGQSAPLYKYRYVIFVFPVVLFSLVLTNDCH